jgi:hypothetical protein
MWRPQVYFALAACLALVVCVDLQVSKSLPELFRTGMAKWVLSQAFLVSVAGAGYFSLRCSLRNGRYHLTNFLILVACVGAVVLLGWAYLSANRVAALLLTESYKGEGARLESMVLVADAALQGEQPEHRLNMARALYRIHGLQAAYADDQGRLTIYTPTEDDKAEFASLAESRRLAGKGLLAVEDKLSRVPNTGMKLILFFACDVARDVWLRLRKKSGRLT